MGRHVEFMAMGNWAPINLRVTVAGGGNDYSCAFGQEPLSDRQAQPSGAAGDQCTLPASLPVITQCRSCSV